VGLKGDDLVKKISKAIGELEAHGHFGPFAVVLGQRLFLVAQSPEPYGAFVLPQDRIIPFLSGGPLLRSSTLDHDYRAGDVPRSWYGVVVVALGGAPVELVFASDMSVQFLQVTDGPRFLFRVREKIALRIKEDEAIVRLYVPHHPTITTVEQNSGPPAGGTTITINGSNLLETTEVKFDDKVACNPTMNTDTRVTVELPAHDPGPVSVTVTAPGGTVISAAAFTYREPPTVRQITPNQGPSAGGAQISITGTNLLGTRKVEFDGSITSNPTVNSANQITVQLPAHAPGRVDVKVTTPSGTVTAAQSFTYRDPPIITGIIPPHGPAAGDVEIAILGTNFFEPLEVKFDGLDVQNPRVTETQITVGLPAHKKGHVNVTVKTPGGTATRPFTYD
jgi:hypothetical protein